MPSTVWSKGTSFTQSVPNEPRTLDSMTRDELDAMLQHSYEQSLAREGRPFETNWKKGWRS